MLVLSKDVASQNTGLLTAVDKLTSDDIATFLDCWEHAVRSEKMDWRLVTGCKQGIDNFYYFITDSGAKVAFSLFDFINEFSVDGVPVLSPLFTRQVLSAHSRCVPTVDLFDSAEDFSSSVEEDESDSSVELEDMWVEAEGSGLADFLTDDDEAVKRILEEDEEDVEELSPLEGTDVEDLSDVEEEISIPGALDDSVSDVKSSVDDLELSVDSIDIDSVLGEAREGIAPEDEDEYATGLLEDDEEEVKFFDLLVERTGTAFEVTSEGPVTVGRSSTKSDVQILGNQKISRCHAKFSVDDDGVLYVEDMGSANGTFINGVVIDGLSKVSSSDIVSLGIEHIKIHNEGSR